MTFWPIERGCFSKYQIPDFYCGFDGVAHGGMVACILYEVASWCVNTVVYHLVLTRKMEITFLKPVPTDVDLFMVSLVTHMDAKNVATYSAIVNAEGIRLAEATADFSLTPHGIIAKLANMEEETLQQLHEQIVVPIKAYMTSLKNNGK